MRRWWIVACVAALALPAMAFEPGVPVPLPGPQVLAVQGSGGPGGNPRAAVARFLELSEDQMATWDQLIADRDAAAQPILERLAEIRQELADLFAGGDPDPAEVGTLVIERHGLVGQLGDIQRAYVEGFVAMLSDEQAARYGLVRRAEQVLPVIPAFRAVGLLPRR